MPISVSRALLLAAACLLPAPPVLAQSDVHLSITGEDRVTRSGDWGRLIDQWRHQIRQATGEQNIVALPYGEAPPLGKPGILIAVHVTSFRYVAPAQRGIPFAGMARATLYGRVSLVDLQTGGVFFERNYAEA